MPDIITIAKLIMGLLITPFASVIIYSIMFKKQMKEIDGDLDKKSTWVSWLGCGVVPFISTFLYIVIVVLWYVFKYA